MMACINKAVLPVWIFVVLCGAQLAPAYATENLTLEATFSSVANGWIPMWLFSRKIIQVMGA